ncbi:hypothetical protein NMK71_01470 [Weeksellaceae bacterium KMM 9713]|uniref:Uncharacterized protein n=1 Tax=Profundicola chukchiensis TaxID=2961959 RepID=A0A9X4MWX3_9FLAO|nr:hypothetical protein [Profundicola chukchiensis]MDG4945070.1 hypothetical protein [Profundicola chukchiensis]
MKILLSIILIIIFCGITLSQETDKNFQKAFEIGLDSLIHNNPNDRYYLENFKTRPSKNALFIFSPDCDILDKDYAEKDPIARTILIPKNRRNYFINQNIFNKIIYGKRYTRLVVRNLFYNELDNKDFILVLYAGKKSGGIENLYLFNLEKFTIQQSCKAYYIY